MAVLRHSHQGCWTPPGCLIRRTSLLFPRSPACGLHKPFPFLESVWTHPPASPASWLLFISYWNLYMREFLRHLRTFFLLPLHMFPKPEMPLMCLLMILQLICAAQIVSLHSRHAFHLTSPLRCFTGIPCSPCPKLNSWFPHSLRRLHLPLVFPISISGLPSTQGPKPEICKSFLIIPFLSPFTSNPTASSVFDFYPYLDLVYLSFSSPPPPGSDNHCLPWPAFSPGFLLLCLCLHLG